VQTKLFSQHQIHFLFGSITSQFSQNKKANSSISKRHHDINVLYFFTNKNKPEPNSRRFTCQILTFDDFKKQHRQIAAKKSKIISHIQKVARSSAIERESATFSHWFCTSICYYQFPSCVIHP
jgi:hypothetical protein